MRNDMSRLALMVGFLIGCLALFVAALVIALGVPSVIAGPDSDPVALQPNPGYSSSEDGCFSVTVAPPAPTESDYIKITVAGWLPNLCWDANSSHTVSGNVVYITVELVDMTPPGMACVDVVMPFSITEEIGQLPAGFYHVLTTLNSSQPPCAPMTPSFEVQPTPIPTPIPNQPPVCSAAAPSVAETWPPNHKMVGVKILGVTDPDGDPISIVITGITQDEPVNGLGDGDSSPDGAGVGTNTAQVRAERAGTPKVPGNGRIYHILFEASDGKSGACSGVVGVGVPHDQRPGHVIVDDGELFDSTVP